MFAVYSQTLVLSLSCRCQQQDGLSALVTTHVKCMFCSQRQNLLKLPQQVSDRIYHSLIFSVHQEFTFQPQKT